MNCIVGVKKPHQGFKNVEIDWNWKPTEVWKTSRK